MARGKSVSGWMLKYGGLCVGITAIGVLYEYFSPPAPTRVLREIRIALSPEIMDFIGNGDAEIEYDAMYSLDQAHRFVDSNQIQVLTFEAAEMIDENRIAIVVPDVVSYSPLRRVLHEDLCDALVAKVTVDGKSRIFVMEIDRIEE
ncbi:hypothetical protein NG895_22410 [Aeoliella sp. ICT_H6.2]|uniref:Uncharacterized protein n=1 Tax=Aeoliella straminimaris TaxID=2954799 RepID=A0A9X2FEF8_9BACT|nr:hypothetical protein [Aeoliella straminimaris]MCO6046658.1 hypothetical protein [Aeoliella straminimaris]